MEDRTVERLRKEHVFGVRVGELAFKIDVEDSLIIPGTGALVGDLREEGGHAAEIRACPFFERMIMAAGALDTDTEEELADDGGDIQLLLHQWVVIGGSGLIHV